MLTGISHIRCSFTKGANRSHNHSGEAEVFYAETKNLDAGKLKKNISKHELERAEKFHSPDDRDTYICCHGLLRQVLSDRLMIPPMKLTFIKGADNKPFLPGNPLYFNISHTRKSFAFVISGNYAGIDLEDINRKLDLKSFLDSTFNPGERRFLTENQDETRERFFLLWTRKEALLKAIGTGIIQDLSKIKVSSAKNFIDKKVIIKHVSDDLSDEHFIYSMRVADNILSIATPGKAEITLNVVDQNSLNLQADKNG
jgi:4'-phosphopantetheinyl transferase